MFPSRKDPYFMRTFPSAPRLGDSRAPCTAGCPGIPSMSWEAANICSKIRNEIGRELLSTMFLKTKRSEAGPSGKNGSVLQV